LNYKSSKNIRRGFCKECGSSLSFRDTQNSKMITLTIASLDAPSLVEPKLHIYTNSQVEWLTIEDDCKRFLQGQIK